MKRSVAPVLLLLLCGSAAFGSMDRVDLLRSIITEFASGDSARFSLAGRSVVGLTIHVGTSSPGVPAPVCRKLHDIHFETVQLLWDSDYSSAAVADYCYLRFQMGSEKDRRFGELPKVDLLFRKGRFDNATITHKIAPDSYRGDSL